MYVCGDRERYKSNYIFLSLLCSQPALNPCLDPGDTDDMTACPSLKGSLVPVEGPISSPRLSFLDPATPSRVSLAIPCVHLNFIYHTIVLQYLAFIIILTQLF